MRALDPIEPALATTGSTWEHISPHRAVLEVASDEAAADVLAQLIGRGVRVVEMVALGGGLEDAFLAMDQDRGS